MGCVSVVDRSLWFWSLFGVLVGFRDGPLDALQSLSMRTWTEQGGHQARLSVCGISWKNGWMDVQSA